MRSIVGMKGYLNIKKSQYNFKHQKKVYTFTSIIKDILFFNLLIFSIYSFI